MQLDTSDAQIRSCRIHHSMGNGIVVDGAQITMRNVALVDNASSALLLASGGRVNGLHLTLARNDTGAYVATGTTAVLTNTILAENTIGVNVAGGGSARLARTLWDNNATPVVGVVQQSGRLLGPAAFDADGYHLTGGSMALGRGLNARVTDDIDGQARPLPEGTRPDLGADESNEPAGFAVYMPLVLRPSP